MKHQFRGILLVAIGVATQLTSQAQTNWYTPEVARRLHQELPNNSPASPPPFHTVEFKFDACRIKAAQVAVFDTTATYVQGRVVDERSYRPIRGATVEVATGYGFMDGYPVFATVTDSAGFFHLGWIGNGGYRRPVRVRAAGYSVVATGQVDFGGWAYLHIELLALPHRR